jgi:hypothetical protein
MHADVDPCIIHAVIHALIPLGTVSREVALSKVRATSLLTQSFRERANRSDIREQPIHGANERLSRDSCENDPKMAGIGRICCLCRYARVCAQGARRGQAEILR